MPEKKGYSITHKLQNMGNKRKTMNRSNGKLHSNWFCEPVACRHMCPPEEIYKMGLYSKTSRRHDEWRSCLRQTGTDGQINPQLRLLRINSSILSFSWLTVRLATLDTGLQLDQTSILFHSLRIRAVSGVLENCQRSLRLSLSLSPFIPLCNWMMPFVNHYPKFHTKCRLQNFIDLHPNSEAQMDGLPLLVSLLPCLLFTFVVASVQAVKKGTYTHRFQGTERSIEWWLNSRTIWWTSDRSNTGLQQLVTLIASRVSKSISSKVFYQFKFQLNNGKVPICHFTPSILYLMWSTCYWINLLALVIENK